jgi:hypothetical protein
MEQLILKHKAHVNAVQIKEHPGMLLLLVLLFL